MFEVSSLKAIKEVQKLVNEIREIHTFHAFSTQNEDYLPGTVTPLVNPLLLVASFIETESVVECLMWGVR